MANFKKYKGELYFFGALWGIFSLIAFFALGIDWQLSTLFIVGAISGIIQAVIPPFSLWSLKHIAQFYRGKAFWKEFVGNEPGRLDANFDDLEKLDKLVSLSRNILLIFATVGAVIITLTSDGLRDWYNKKELRVMGSLIQGCDKGQVDPTINNAFIIIDYLDEGKQPFKTDEDDHEIKEVIKVNNGQYSKTLILPKEVKYVKLNFYQNNGYSLCQESKVKPTNFVRSAEKELIYLNFPIDIKKAEDTSEIKKRIPEKSL